MDLLRSKNYVLPTNFMDALAAFGVNWKLLLIQAVNFSLLLLILYKFLYKPLFAMLEKRQRAIEQGLKDAEHAAKTREDIESQKGALMASARETGGKLVEELRKQAIEQEKEIIRSAQEKSAAVLQEAQIRAGAEREHILRESEKEVARMATLAAEKILRSSN